ncbi:MAG: hypothetical protein WCF61_09155, partial [Terriglobales bacterium]
MRAEAGMAIGVDGAPGVPARQTGSTGADEASTPREHCYRLAAGTFAASAAVGMVVTRPCVPVACAGTAAGGGVAVDGTSPSAFLTSASSLAMVS